MADAEAHRSPECSGRAEKSTRLKVSAAEQSQQHRGGETEVSEVVRSPITRIFPSGWTSTTGPCPTIQRRHRSRTTHLTATDRTNRAEWSARFRVSLGRKGRHQGLRQAHNTARLGRKDCRPGCPHPKGTVEQPRPTDHRMRQICRPRLLAGTLDQDNHPGVDMGVASLRKRRKANACTTMRITFAAARTSHSPLIPADTDTGMATTERIP